MITRLIIAAVLLAAAITMAVVAYGTSVVPSPVRGSSDTVERTVVETRLVILATVCGSLSLVTAASASAQRGKEIS